MGPKDSTLKHTTDLKAHGVATQLVDQFAAEPPLKHLIEAPNYNTPTNNEKKRKQITPGSINESFPNAEISGQKNITKNS